MQEACDTGRCAGSASCGDERGAGDGGSERSVPAGPAPVRRAARLRRAVSGHSYELLFVDDASPDHAHAVIRRLAGQDPRVCGIVLAENVGQNSAVLAGLAHARGTTVAVMDGDLQDPPEAVPALLEALERHGADAVFAARRGHYETLPRLATGRLLKRTLWALTILGILTLLLFDFFFHVRTAHTPTLIEAAIWSAV